jgi:hypothetical protein
MRAFAFAILLAASAFTPMAANAGCHDCPVPMSHWFGIWSSAEKGMTIEVRAVNNNPALVQVELRDLATDRVIARGIAFATNKGRELKAHLTREDGNEVNVSFFKDNEKILYAGSKFAFLK